MERERERGKREEREMWRERERCAVKGVRGEFSTNRYRGQRQVEGD